MTYAAYGYGQGTSVIGSVVAFGLGRVFLSPVQNVSIGFDLTLDLQIAKQLQTAENVFLSTTLTIEELNTLTANSNIILGTQLDLTNTKQLDASSNILFNTDLDLESIGQLITFASAEIGVTLDIDEAGFVLDPGRVKQNVYIIPEELRFLPVFMELRECAVTEEVRTEIIKYEDRTIIVIEGD